jgi:hypothetical protein
MRSVEIEFYDARKYIYYVLDSPSVISLSRNSSNFTDENERNLCLVPVTNQLEYFI